MKNTSAFEYMDKININLLDEENARIAKRYFARMEKIDEKLFSLKAERRGLADWFLGTIKAQRAGK